MRYGPGKNMFGQEEEHKVRDNKDILKKITEANEIYLKPIVSF